MKKIAILSHVVMDEIHRPDTSQSSKQIGGAGAYAAVGASLAGAPRQTLIVSGVGRDDRPLVATWARTRGIDARGLFDVGQHSPRTHIQYFDDGERIETPFFGTEHFEAHTPLPRHIPDPDADLAGAYVFHAHEAPYWDEVSSWRRQAAVPMLWEISRDSCERRHLARVRELAEGVDVLSLNLSEARRLLERGDKDLLDELAGLAHVVILRMGERGSLVIDNGKQIDVTTLDVEAVDPTGGGNSYSGAFLAAFCASGNPADAARTATAAAALVVSTAGTPRVDDDARKAIAHAASTLTVTIRKDSE